jgi:hypothetical protein
MAHWAERAKARCELLLKQRGDGTVERPDRAWLGGLHLLKFRGHQRSRSSGDFLFEHLIAGMSAMFLLASRRSSCS